MKKFILSSIVCCFLISAMFAQNVESDFIYFDFDKFDLTENAKLVLDQTIFKIENESIFKVKIVGHTDSDGNNKYNETLSKNRAIEVFAYLVKNGIAKEFFTIDYFDEQNPVATNINENGKQQNRRVEIIYSYYNPIIATTNSASNSSSYYDKNVETVYSLQSEKNVVENIIVKKSKILQRLKTPEPEKFVVVAENPIKIYGSKGTIIAIPPNAFVDKNGEIVTGEVEILLEEFYTKSDWVLNNLETTCNGELLESGGMINIIANKNGEVLKLAEGKSFEIGFKKISKEKSFYTFNGTESENKIDWTTDEENMKNRFRDELVDEDLFLQDRTYLLKMDTTEVLNKIFDNYDLTIKDKKLKVWENLDLKEIEKKAIIKNYPGLSKLPDVLNLGSLFGYANKQHTLVRFLTENRKAIFNSKRQVNLSAIGNSGFNKEESIEKLILTSTKLGWVNCDKFQKVIKITNMFVKIDNFDKPNVRLVFKDINSMMTGFYEKDGVVSFRNIPQGKKATIVAYNKDGEALSFRMQTIETLKSNENQLAKMELKETTISQMEKALLTLNN